MKWSVMSRISATAARAGCSGPPRRFESQSGSDSRRKPHESLHTQVTSFVLCESCWFAELRGHALAESRVRFPDHWCWQFETRQCVVSRLSATKSRSGTRCQRWTHPILSVLCVLFTRTKIIRLYLGNNVFLCLVWFPWKHLSRFVVAGRWHMFVGRPRRSSVVLQVQVTVVPRVTRVCRTKVISHKRHNFDVPWWLILQIVERHDATQKKKGPTHNHSDHRASRMSLRTSTVAYHFCAV